MAFISLSLCFPLESFNVFSFHIQDQSNRFLCCVVVPPVISAVLCLWVGSGDPPTIPAQHISRREEHRHRPLSSVPLFLLAIPFAYSNGVWFPNAVFTEGIQSMCYIKICRMSANFVKTNCLPISSLLIIKSCNACPTKEVFCPLSSDIMNVQRKVNVTKSPCHTIAGNAEEGAL